MKLDLIIATHNRAMLLTRLLESLRAAERPPELSVRVIVVDNNSTDGTREAVLSQKAILDHPVLYVFEAKQGKTAALNRGLKEIEGDLVGFLDDDEEVDKKWLRTIHRAFQDPSIDFISGPYRPNWGAEPPKWLPKSYPAVIGWIDPGNHVLKYGDDYDGIMMGGNAIVRRAFIDRVGPFNLDLGRTAERLTTGEDADYHERLVAAGARGYYLPDLVIYHYIPPERLTKRYHRRWCFYRGISLAHIDRARRQPVRYFLGVPRYLFGDAARGVLTLARAAGQRALDSEHAFSSELRLWDLAGFLYGKYFVRPPRRAAAG